MLRLKWNLVVSGAHGKRYSTSRDNSGRKGTLSMSTENENPEPGKRGGKASREQVERDRRNPPELLAYSIEDIVERVPFGRSTVYEEIKAGRLIARKVRGRTIILPTDAKNYLRSLPTTKDAALEPDVA